MNDLSLQTAPFNGGTIDGRYWQIVRRNDLHAYDNLPPKIRAYMQENFSELPAEDVLYDFRYTYGGDEDRTLSALIADNSAIRRAVADSEKLVDCEIDSAMMAA